eukprot:6064753-Prymnesium_polylepis.1
MDATPAVVSTCSPPAAINSIAIVCKLSPCVRASQASAQPPWTRKQSGGACAQRGRCPNLPSVPLF